MKSVAQIIVLTVLALSLVNCAKKKESFSYDLEEDACPTGKHVFSKKVDYCRALKDDVANNNCANKARTEQYNKDCGAAAPVN